MLPSMIRAPLSTIDIAQTRDYNPRDQWAQIEIAFQPGVWRYIADTPGVFVSLGFADTQTALGGFGTVRLNETNLPGDALFLGKFGQFESSNGDELAGTHGPWSTPQGHSYQTRNHYARICCLQQNHSRCRRKRRISDLQSVVDANRKRKSGTAQHLQIVYAREYLWFELRRSSRTLRRGHKEGKEISRRTADCE